MPIPLQLGSTPIAGTFPAGQDAKNSAAYEAVTAEIAKLSSMQGANALNWGVVVKEATNILSEQAKDISMAVYLAIALAETEGLHGWLAGGNVLKDVLELWWDEAFPPLKRMRARVNSLDWWHERSKLFLNAPHNPIEAETYAALLELVQTLDTLIGERLPDCQPLYDVREAVHRLDVIAEPQPEAIAEPAPQPAADSTPATAQPSVRPTATTPSVTPMSSPVPASIDPADPEAAKKSAAMLVQVARSHYDLMFATACPEDTLAWQALYTALWGNLHTLPPEEAGKTMIPAPDADRLQSFPTLLQSGRYEQAARAAALFTPASPFCLDVHSLIAKALSRLGARYADALHVVEQHMHGFTQRLKGIERLCFADGTPFASDDTRAWIENLGAPKSKGQPESGDITSVLDAATVLADERQLPKALELLHTAMNGALPAEKMRLHIAEIRLLSQNKHAELAVALAEHLLATLDVHRLDLWDACLCEEALLAIHAALCTHEGSQETARAVARRLAVLNSIAALGLPSRATPARS